MIEAFGVKNLRCLTDTGLVDLKPITLLVGRNSSGKSTFLRAFPLLRQSVERRRKSPILWYDRDYVDFGSLDVAVNEQRREEGVTFSFRAKMDAPELTAFVGEPVCELSMTVQSAKGNDYVRALEVEIAGKRLRVELGPDRRATTFFVGAHTWSPEAGPWLVSDDATLIPGLWYSSSSKLTYRAFPGQETGDIVFTRGDVTFAMALFEELKSMYPQHDEDELLRLATSTPAGSTNDVWKWLNEALTEMGIASGPLKLEDEAVQDILDCAFLSRLPDVLASFDWMAGVLSGGVAYLGPQRSVGQRQYRKTEEVADEIQANGENLPQFLVARSDEEMANLARFTREHLGFETTVRTQGLNIEILIQPTGAQGSRNIADVGFGYAEVLPLCVSLWWNLVRSHPGRPTTVLALEQPELHLHPAHQARLASLFVAALKQNRELGGTTSLLIETHSEAVVNSLGTLVREKQIDANDIQILFFDQNKDTQETEITRAGYTPTGALKDWPIGFLAPVADRLEDLVRATAAE